MTSAPSLLKTSSKPAADHILPPSEGHLRSVLAEFVSYYNQDRPPDRSGWVPADLGS